ncbi:MAG: 6-bladed beta-propeller [Balneolaceae bacterium]
MANKQFLIFTMGIALAAAGCSSSEVEQTDAFSELPAYELELVEALSDQGDLIVGQPTYTEIDSDGNRLVMDLSSFEIHVYDREGIYQNSFGREGNGPGEFQQPARPIIGENDTLYISDYMRRSLLVLYKSGDYNWSSAYDVAYPQSENGFPSRALTPTQDGYPVIYRSNEALDEFPDGYYEVRLLNRRGNSIGNTDVKFRSGSGIALRVGENRVSIGLSEMPNNQMTPKNDGTYFQAWNGDPVIYHYRNDGELLKEIHLDGYPVQEVTGDAISALNERMFGGQFGDLSRELRDSIGDTFPLFSQIMVTHDESLWLARIVPESSNQSWYHLSPDGQPLGRLTLEEGQRLRNADGDHIYVSGEMDDGSPAILTFRVEQL